MPSASVILNWAPGWGRSFSRARTRSRECRSRSPCGSGAAALVKPLVDGFTTEIPSPHQRLRVLVHPSGLDMSSSALRLLSAELRRRREDETVIGADSTLQQSVDRIMLDTGLAHLPAVDRWPGPRRGSCCGCMPLARTRGSSFSPDTRPPAAPRTPRKPIGAARHTEDGSTRLTSALCARACQARAHSGDARVADQAANAAGTVPRVCVPAAALSAGCLDARGFGGREAASPAVGDTNGALLRPRGFALRCAAPGMAQVGGGLVAGVP